MRRLWNWLAAKVIELVGVEDDPTEKSDRRLPLFSNPYRVFTSAK